MNYVDDKNQTLYATTAYDNKLPALEQEDKKLKKSIRVLRFLYRLVSAFLNLWIIGTLSYSLAKYYLTRNHIISGNVHPWSNPTVLWPTFMLLGIAVVTFVMNILTLFAYSCGIGASNKVHTFSSVIQYTLLGVHVVVWAVVTGAFKMASNGKDLWGWSCSTASDAIQDEVKSFLDFGKLCTLQTGTWYMSIIEAIVYFLTFVTTILMARRLSHKKKLNRARESMISMEPINNQFGEAETSYNPSLGRQYIPVQSQHV